MSARHQRWLTMREMLSLQGFPMSCAFTHDKPCSSFALRDLQKSRGLPFAPWPSRRAACHQSGNSMHVCVSGLTILFCLTQTIFDNNMLALQTFLKKGKFQPFGIVESKELHYPQNSKKAKL